MLKQRVLTALVLIPLVIWGVLELPDVAFAVVVAVFILLGAWEWGRLAGLVNPLLRLSYVALTALLLGWFWYLLPSEQLTHITLYGALVWWILGLVMVYRFNVGGEGFKLSFISKALIGLMVLLPTWVGLVVMRSDPTVGPSYVLYLLILIWVADSAAYFSGRKWGRVKLAVRVSPGKTREGVAGALVGVMCVSIGWGIWHDFSLSAGILFSAACLFVALGSVLGDLVESLFKRQAGIKDSGAIFPGHGGMLDRIDSLTAAAPLFLLSLYLIRGIS